MAFKRKRYVKKNKFIRRKKTFRRKRTFRKTSNMDATMVRGSDWISNKLVNVLEYRERVYLTSLTTPFEYAFRGNGCFDPNQTGTGNSCLGFTSLASIYTQYECPRSTITVEFINNTVQPVWVMVAPLNTVRFPTIDQSVGVPGLKKKYCTAKSDNAHVVVRNSSSTWKILNLTSKSGETKANVTTNPNSQWYWAVTLNTCDNATTLTGILLITIRYKTIWSGRKDI